MNELDREMAIRVILVAIVLLVIIGIYASSISSSESPSVESGSSTQNSGTIQPPPSFEFPEVDYVTVNPPASNVNGSNKFYVSWSAKLISNNHVGSDWRTFVTVGGEDVGSSPITVNGNVLTVDVKAVEFDSLNDVGRDSMNFYCNKIGASQTQTIRVTVRENRGKYTGNVAVWEFTVTVTRAN